MIAAADVFAEIKQRVQAIDAARTYGIAINAHGFARCPFHEGDNTPSLKFFPDGGWKCFACQAGGDVVDLAARYYGLSEPIDAARRLDIDFGLALFDRQLTMEQRRELEAARREREAERRRGEVSEAFRQIVEGWRDDIVFDLNERTCELHARRKERNLQVEKEYKQVEAAIAWWENLEFWELAKLYALEIWAAKLDEDYIFEAGAVKVG